LKQNFSFSHFHENLISRILFLNVYDEKERINDRFLAHFYVNIEKVICTLFDTALSATPQIP
jgi:hypothetical protein